jgi:hypothetical protein
VAALDPSQAGAMQVNCTPAALVAHQATLTLLTTRSSLFGNDIASGLIGYVG